MTAPRPRPGTVVGPVSLPVPRYPTSAASFPACDACPGAVLRLAIRELAEHLALLADPTRRLIAISPVGAEPPVIPRASM